MSSGFTDVTGHYTTGAGLVAGSYYLQTSNSQGYIYKTRQISLAARNALVAALQALAAQL